MKIYLKGGSLYFKVSNVWVKTGIKVTPGGWNHKKQCVRGWVPLADELNDELASQKAQLTSTIRKIRNAGKKVSNTPVLPLCRKLLKLFVENVWNFSYFSYFSTVGCVGNNATNIIR